MRVLTFIPFISINSGYVSNPETTPYVGNPISGLPAPAESRLMDAEIPSLKNTY
jgi:hypothetical protein